jgi:hypothetical protein
MKGRARLLCDGFREWHLRRSHTNIGRDIPHVIRPGKCSIVRVCRAQAETPFVSAADQ